MRRELLWGAAAGAAGTTALNVMTYLDMAIRARPASTTPEETVHRVEQLSHLPLSAEGSDSEAATNRRSGLGALLGAASGVGIGALYGLLRPHLRHDIPVALLGATASFGANAGTVAPMAALGVTDPRTWSAGDWLSDLLPHLAYGVITAAVFERLWRRPSRLGIRGRLRRRPGGLPPGLRRVRRAIDEH